LRYYFYVARKPSEPLLVLAKSWYKVGEQALDAAQILRDKGHWRGAVNRSYYAAYSFSACLLSLEEMEFRLEPTGLQREGPEHKPLPDLIGEHLRRRLGRYIKDFRTLVGQLYNLRIASDYRPSASIRDDSGIQALKQATQVRVLTQKEMESF
jgi:hypothetical protein